MKPKKTTLYCFSPPVMLATIVIELALAVMVFVRIKPSRIKSLTVATLLLLAVFQGVEFLVCGAYSGVDGNLISRIGFVTITLLPPLGIHMANEIAGRRKHWTTTTSYLLAGAFIIYFGLAPEFITSSICTGNYVIFHLSEAASVIYMMYYFSLLFVAIGLSAILAIKQKSKSKRNALHWLIVGILTFLLPTGAIYWLAPDAVAAIPSVMCGFAIIYAIILAFKIAPLKIASKTR